MMSRFKEFVSRHRRKFIVSGIAIGGSILAVRYAQTKFREFNEKQAREFIEKTRRIQHFESTERTCNQVIIGLSTNLYNEIIKLINTDEILETLRNNSENKLELWNELKILSFTRLTTFIYATSMLVITLRIQLNLLGGYLYKDTVSDNAKISNEIRQAYLSFIQHFLGEGLNELIAIIKNKVTDVMKSHPLTERLSLSDMEQIFWSIQMAINSSINDPNSKMTQYVLPNKINDIGLLEKMFTESIDILESDDVTALCSNSICRGFSIAVDNIAEYMSPLAAVEKDIKASKEIININKIDMPLAKLIPIVCGITSKSFDNLVKPPNLATSLVTFYLVTEKIKTLGANVYEVFSV